MVGGLEFGIFSGGFGKLLEIHSEFSQNSLGTLGEFIGNSFGCLVGGFEDFFGNS